jgi:hypothetical protein
VEHQQHRSRRKKEGKDSLFVLFRKINLTSFPAMIYPVVIALALAASASANLYTAEPSHQKVIIYLFFKRFPRMWQN